MSEKRVVENLTLFLCLAVSFSLFIFQDSVAKESPSTYLQLTLENQPEVSGITVLKLTVLAGYDAQDADIGCFLPQGLELINDKGYKNIPLEPPASAEKGSNVKFYSGSMKKGEKKEFMFKVRVSDEKKYIIGAGALDGSNYLEIDLGDPEPPEEGTYDRERIKRLLQQTPEARNISKTTVAKEAALLPLSADEPLPLRTEFRIRTKERPYVQYCFFQPTKEEPFPTIPLRYLIYTPEEAPQAEVNLYLPAGIELVNARDYPVSQEENRTKVLVYSGPMRFKECKAFYLQVQVKPFKRELFSLEIKTQVTNLKNEEFFKQDKVEIDLIPKRY